MVTRFIQYLKSEKRYSEHTLRAYKSDMQQLVAYFDIADNELINVSHRQLRLWFSELMSQGLNARSVNRKISSASAFYSYLVRERLLAQNPIEKVITPKNAKRLPFFYKEEELHALLDGERDGSSYEEQRNHAMIELLYATGMRLSELVGLRCNDVSLDAQTVKVLGKGNKERIIPLCPSLCQELRLYAETLSSHFAALPDSAFFRTAKGEPVYPGLVYRVVHSGLEMQGVKGKKSPHVLRHSFATHMLNNGANLNSIKDLLGHSSLRATQVYTHNSVEKLLKSYHNAHPHAGDN
ncbi:MAG: tyrosine-type recombinase/integrase [Prevotellaceae bacterium]|jgi:integrase/recombinase XerC|nr:tyrosine-type recombinase/integrase [Prevotellaceae bacterium]